MAKKSKQKYGRWLQVRPKQHQSSQRSSKTKAKKYGRCKKDPGHDSVI